MSHERPGSTPASLLRGLELVLVVCFIIHCTIGFNQFGLLNRIGPSLILKTFNKAPRFQTTPSRKAMAASHDEQFAHCKLPYSLQTWVGMVLSDGEPTRRPFPPYDRYEALAEVEPFSLPNRQLRPEEFRQYLTMGVVERKLPNIDLQAHRPYSQSSRLAANIYACCNTAVANDTMKGCINARVRLDLEQAAAVVISVIGNNPRLENKEIIIRSLISGLDEALVNESHMWLEPSFEVRIAIEDPKFSHLANFLQRSILVKTQYSISLEIKDWSDLLNTLLQIRRRSRPNRCIYVPPWVFERAQAAMPSDYPAWREDHRSGRGEYPIQPPDNSSIALPRKLFRVIQRRINAYFRFWDPEVHLHHEINRLESVVLYAEDHIKSTVAESDDTLLIAHYFFAFQRRMQRRVVSDISWTRFLAKGEGKLILQNNPNLKTLFEEDLSNFAGLDGVPITQDTTDLMDRCCLLMEKYVQVYGDGDRSKLTFTRGVRGGSGRGPVDQYNLLCEILMELRNAAKREDLEAPGPVHKFLAKDIMSCNNAWADDAFANGKIPGWEPWLAARRKAGKLPELKKGDRKLPLR